MLPTTSLYSKFCPHLLIRSGLDIRSRGHFNRKCGLTHDGGVIARSRSNPDEGIGHLDVRCREVLDSCSKTVLTAALAASFWGISFDGNASLGPQQAITSDRPVLDLARVVPSGREQELENRLKDLEQRSGWRVRLLTKPGPKAGPSEDEIRAVWQLDSRSSLIVVDPTSPNILQFRSGAEVNRLLSRPFFVELQSRYGNMFFVREEGEAAAVMGVVDALVECLETPGGCAVVPGLPSNQYQLTLITSVIGGFIAGYASRLQPEGGPPQEYLELLPMASTMVISWVDGALPPGMVRRKWIWLLLFSPLWGTLFISFGIGPIVTRTSDRLPVLVNTAAFLAAALVFRLSPLFKQSAIDTSILKRSTQKSDDDS